MSFERVANPFVVDMNAPRISLPLGLGLGLGRLVTVVSTTGRPREGQPIYWAAAAAGVVQFAVPGAFSPRRPGIAEWVPEADAAAGAGNRAMSWPMRY